MIILALDASSKTGAVALCDGEKLLCEKKTAGERTHSESLLPLTDKVLKESGRELKDVDLFACVVGPGSFTGVRIAVCLVKGLAFASDKPCAAVSSLAALAYGVERKGCIVCPVIDARRGNAYNALFKDGKRLCEDRLISYSQLADELKKTGEKVLVCGDGRDALREAYGDNTLEELAFTVSGHGAALAALEIYNKQKIGMTDRALSPEYLRPSQAERERLEREEKKS